LVGEGSDDDALYDAHNDSELVFVDRAVSQLQVKLGHEIEGMVRLHFDTKDFGSVKDCFGVLQVELTKSTRRATNLPPIK
jgi:hypothetical protein